MSRIIITDTSLRDGSHTVRHQFSPDNVQKVVTALDAAGINIIEVGHGDGLMGSTCNYGFAKHSDLELVTAAVSAAHHAQIAVLCLPGIGTVPDLEDMRKAGAKVVRVATHVTEADISAEHIHAAKGMGYFVVGFLMMVHRAEPDRVVEEALKMESYGADVVYCTDSAGALLPDGVTERVAAVKAALKVPIGFHSHNNMGVSVANSLAALKAGATYVDGSLGGLGAGAGNTATEEIVALLNKTGYEHDADLYKALDAADVLKSVVAAHGVQMPNIQDPLILGYAGVYSSFMLHAKRAAQRFQVDYRDIIMECGNRRAVGGQEDWIIEIANQLANRKQ